MGSFGITGWHDQARVKGPGVTIGRSGASIGTAVFIQEDYWPLNTCLYVTDFKGNDPRWVFHTLGLIDFAAYNSGSAQPSLNRNYLARIPIAVPPLNEQRRIAAVLGALDDLIEANRLAVRQTRELSGLLYRQSAAKAVGRVSLGAVAGISYEKTKPGIGAITYLDIAALGDGTLDLPHPIDWAVAPSRARMKPGSGSTLWSTVRPNRRAHALLVKAPDDLVVSTGIAVLRPTGIGPAELFAATDQNEFVEQLVSKADGSAYPAVRPKDFASIAIARLDAEQSAAFEHTMWPLWLDADEATKEIARLTRARDELLPLLMSGRVRVSESLAVA